VKPTFVHVVRHAEAGVPAQWTGPDLLRPLSPGGRRQAMRLAKSFDDEPFIHLLSSPFLRCTETFGPLAAARGLPIEMRDELADGQPWEFVQKAVTESEGEGPAAICVHGEALRGLLRDLSERGVARPDREDFQKGSTWVLGVRDGAIVSARHVAAPPSD
jgi:8-oxo-(d)GTP phosphatase